MVLFACVGSDSNCVHQFSGNNYFQIGIANSVKPSHWSGGKREGEKPLDGTPSPWSVRSHHCFDYLGQPSQHRSEACQEKCFYQNLSAFSAPSSWERDYACLLLLGTKRSGNLMSGFLWPPVCLLRGQIDEEGAREQACQCSKIGSRNKSSPCFYCTIFALSGLV